MKLQPEDYVVSSVVVSPLTEEEKAEEERQKLLASADTGGDNSAETIADRDDDADEDDAGDEVLELAEGEDTGSGDSETEEGDDESAEEKDVPVGRRLALLSVSENGYGKRTLMSRYGVKGRRTIGYRDLKTEGRNGLVIGTCEVEETHEIMLTTTTGRIIRMPVSSIRLIARQGKGVRLIRLDEGEKVASVTRIVDEGSNAERGTQEGQERSSEEPAEEQET